MDSRYAVFKDQTPPALAGAKKEWQYITTPKLQGSKQALKTEQQLLDRKRRENPPRPVEVS
jgi:hypothetical protein